MPFIPLHDKTPRVLVAQPWVTWGMMLACAGVFLIEIGGGRGDFQRLVYGFGMIPATITGQAQLPPELYQVPALATLFTHQFLHGGLLHLVFNMAYLWVFGDNVEDAMGHGRFVVFYLVCGALAAVTHLAADTGSTVPTVGASGAISGILGAYLVLHPGAKILVPVIFIPFYLPAYLLLVFWIGFQFYAATMAPTTESGVAWWAHIGGFVAGMILIVPFRRKTVPLWSTGELPQGLKMTVYKRRSKRKSPWSDDGTG